MRRVRGKWCPLWSRKPALRKDDRSIRLPSSIKFRKRWAIGNPPPRWSSFTYIWMAHPTKGKGDIGLAMVIADLTKKGHSVCLPLAEHLPFDMVVASDDGGISRVQVKYRTAQDGAVVVKLTSGYANSKGIHQTRNDHTRFDAYAVYCPDTDCVYYIPNWFIVDRKLLATLTLRVAGTNFANGHSCEDFKNHELIF